jgi:hypothetical protein
MRGWSRGASALGTGAYRRIGVATAPQLTGGCFNRSAPKIAMGFSRDGTTCIDLYTSQTIRYESHFLAFPSAYYHFPHGDPPNAPAQSHGKDNDGILEIRLASSQSGMNFPLIFRTYFSR